MDCLWECVTACGSGVYIYICHRRLDVKNAGKYSPGNPIVCNTLISISKRNLSHVIFANGGLGKPIGMYILSLSLFSRSSVHNIFTYRLKEHLRSHQSATPFKCNVCQKQFAKKSEWKTHRHAHNTQRSIVKELITTI